MRGIPRGRPGGFTLLELVLVVCLVAVLATLGAGRLMRLRVEAERTVFDSTLGALRSALGIQVAQHFSKHRTAELAQLVGSNPMDYLAELPQNYRGPFYGIDPGLIAGGEWYFDTRDRTLVYRVRFDDYFSSPLPGPARARVGVEPVYEDVNRNGRFDADADSLKGLRLSPREPYRWLDDPE
jgi:prepilin-type N-terminal cleavage/methylation domain-containing protein